MAAAIGIRASRTVRADGDSDFRGTRGVDRTVSVGLSDIRLSFELESDGSENELATLLRLTEWYRVVFETPATSPT